MKQAYPSEIFETWGERSVGIMVRYVQRFQRVGHPIPAAVAAAREVLDKPKYLVPVSADACVAAACAECTCAECS